MFLLVLRQLIERHLIERHLIERYLIETTFDGGGGGFTRPIPGDGGADQLRGVPVIGRFPTDWTRGLEVTGCDRIWPDADGPVQGSQARDAKDPVVQNHSCCMKKFRLDQLCGE